MKNYEGMLVIRPDLQEEAMKVVTTQIADVISKGNGQIEEAKVWGKRQLGYPVKKFKEGVFYLISFKANPEAISGIKREYKLNENIIRMLIINKDQEIGSKKVESK